MAPAVGLPRRLFAEFLGTGLLVSVVVGSGIAAQRLFPGETGLQLLANSLATAAGLAVLIVVLAPVSGAHLNPVVTAVDAVLTRGHPARPAASLTAGYAVAQVLGALAGAELANLMFQVPLAQLSDQQRTGAGLWLGEVVATAGLVVVIFALIRSGRAALVGPMVGAYIGAAYWFTSSTAFANPAVTIGRVFSDTFAGIAPSSVPAFVLAQALGGVLGAVIVLVLHPTQRADAAGHDVPTADTVALPARGGRAG